MKTEYNYTKEGNLLYELRNKRKMTQYELAKLLETDYRNISKYELGKNFPDKEKQAKLCEIFNITLEELHNGEINIAKRAKDKLIRLLLCIFSIITPIFLICIITLGIVLIDFKINYDPSNIYYIDIEDDSSVYCNIDGIYVNSKNENIIYIGTIKLLDYKTLDTDHIDVIFYYGDKIIYSTSSLNNMMFKLDSSIPVGELRFTITIKDNKNKLKHESEYNINAFLAKKEDITTARISNVNNNRIINELLKMGFKKVNDNEYVYTENNKDREIKVSYIVRPKRLSYEEITANLMTSIRYYLINDVMEVEITSIGKSKIVIENYEYYLQTKNLINKVGQGYTLNDSLKIMDKYISRLKGE